MVGPFRDSFPDFHMEVIDVIAEDEKVMGYFKCSGTHEDEWRGHPPTGRRFEAVDEVCGLSATRLSVTEASRRRKQYYCVYSPEDPRRGNGWGLREDDSRDSGAQLVLGVYGVLMLVAGALATSVSRRTRARATSDPRPARLG